MVRPGRHVVALVLALAPACQSLDRFDTKKGAAYCGRLVDSQFVWTPDTQGGFDRQLRLRLQIDTSLLTTIPGKITSDDPKGPCTPSPTFDRALLRVTPEIVGDALSTMTFADGQVHSIVAWVDSSCRGKVLAIVSLYKDNHVDVRLLRPGSESNDPEDRDAFALFSLERYENGCGY